MVHSLSPACSTPAYAPRQRLKALRCLQSHAGPPPPNLLLISKPLTPRINIPPTRPGGRSEGRRGISLAPIIGSQNSPGPTLSLGQLGRGGHDPSLRTV